MTHRLLTSVHCSFNLLRTFKEGAHCSKTDDILLKDTHALIKSVLVRWAPSLNDRSKLKGQYTNVKSEWATLVGPTLNPHSLSKKKILVLLSL